MDAWRSEGQRASVATDGGSRASRSGLYGWFTAGLDRLDLKRAKALLVEFVVTMIAAPNRER